MLCSIIYKGTDILLLSLHARSLGDLTAATVGCTSDPEVTYTTLRPGVDHVLVMATDGVWDVLTNEQVSETDCNQLKYSAAQALLQVCHRVLYVLGTMLVPYTDE